MNNLAEVKKIPLSSLSKKSEKISTEIHVGKDILDLVTNAMYVEPLSIFREYVQNAADAIDEAKEKNIYSKNSTPKIEISININERNIKIRDNGIGIEKGQLEDIFKEFYKTDFSRHDLDSSGLGLSICRQIIEKHGGRIWADSKGLGKGSIFYFTLKTNEKISF